MFELQTGTGYKLFVKLSNIIDSDRWEKLSKIINIRIGKTTGFVPGDGRVMPLKEIISGDTPEWCKPCYVYSVPDQFTKCWKEQYKPTRKALNELGLNYKWRRTKPYDRKTIFIIDELNKRIDAKIKIDEIVCIEIALNVMSKFDPKGIKKPYAFESVQKVYNRYVNPSPNRKSRKIT